MTLTATIKGYGSAIVDFEGIAFMYNGDAYVAAPGGFVNATYFGSWGWGVCDCVVNHI